ncbi:MAG: hypothetical protein Q4C00_04190 [Bacillota bacterium]|nr:hypothetical protein [Bacillota bacterium]
MRKIIAIFIGLILAVSFSAGAYAAENDDLMKDETIYINLNSNGSVEQVQAVNHIATPEAGIYVDYGDYSAIDNITGKEEPIVEGNKITWDLPQYENGFYYIGTLKAVELPWNFGITYFLDNKKVDAQDLAGATGEVKIKINAVANSKAENYFKDNFAMQMSLALDTDICSDIEALGGTTVLAGKTMTVSYTALPESDVNATITFDAKDLELPGLSVIFSPFSMDSYGSMGELEDNVTAMVDAMDALISGTQKLQSGMEQLTTGVGTLNEGSQALAEGADAADEGMEQYQQGLNTFSSYISAFASEMDNSLGALEDAGKNLESAKTALNQSAAKVEAAINNIDRTAQGYQNNIQALEEALNGLSTGLKDISSGLEKIMQANSGMSSQLQSIVSGYGDLEKQYEAVAASLTSSSTAEVAANAILADPNESDAAKEVASAYLQAVGTMSTVKTNLIELNRNFVALNSSFSGGIEDIDNGYGDINIGIEKLQTTVNNTTQALSGGFDFSAIKSQLSALETELANASQVLSRFDVSSFNIDVDKYSSGMEEMESAVNALNEKFRLLHEGISNGLFSGIADLNSGIYLIYENIEGLPGSVDKLNSGQKQLKDGINSALDEFAGDDSESEPMSFAAPGYITPNTIQFIAATPGITKGTTVYKEEPMAAEPTLWQKIKDIFS